MSSWMFDNVHGLFRRRHRVPDADSSSALSLQFIYSVSVQMWWSSSGVTLIHSSVLHNISRAQLSVWETQHQDVLQDSVGPRAAVTLTVLTSINLWLAETLWRHDKTTESLEENKTAESHISTARNTDRRSINFLMRRPHDTHESNNLSWRTDHMMEKTPQNTEADKLTNTVCVCVCEESIL